MDSVFILVVSAILAAVPLGFSLVKGKLDLFSPPAIFGFGFTASYGLKAFLMTRDSNIWITYPDKTTDLSFFMGSFLVSCGGLIAFYCGYYAPRIIPRKAFPDFSFSDINHQVNRLLSNILVGLGLVSIALLLYFIRFDIRGLITIEFASVVRYAAMEAWDEYPMLFHIPIWIGFFTLMSVHSTLFLANGKLQGAQKIQLICIIATSSLVLVALGSRALLLTLVLSLLIYRHYYVKRIGVIPQMVALLLLVILGGYFGVIQKIDSQIGLTAIELEFPDNILYRLSSSYEQFEVFLNVVSINPPLDWGGTIFEDICYTYIPRAIWPDKPLDFGFVRAQNVVFWDYWQMSRATTYPIGVLGELFFNFGYAGIFIGMLFLGALLNRMWECSKELSSPYPAIFSVFLASFLAPHRTFGTVLMTVMLYFVFGYFVLSLGRIRGVMHSLRTDTSKPTSH
jgi:oligosaccharide repeat unit polymerase